jgi:hypothetical protein
MRRLVRWVLLALIVWVASAGSAFATPYYIAANGSDSNNGTSRTTPWQHAPGMSTCSATCASTTIGPGDSIVFRGGDTWHFGNSSLSPFAGYKDGAWTFSASGSSGNCQLNPAAGAIVTTSCIYIGVDQTWYSGSSWTRPKFNMDNPVTTSSPSSCAYEDSSYNLISFGGRYLVIDNLEILGYCWNTTSPWNEVVNIGANDEMKNSYWHGWTMGSIATGCGSCDSDEYWAINSPNSLSQWSRIDHDVFDGSDSTFGNLSGSYGDATGGLFRGGGEIDHNVLVHFSNGVKYTLAYIFHDNYINYAYEPAVGGTHGNIFELPPTTWSRDSYYYNNLVLYNNIGETVDFYPGSSSSGKAGYIFNNVVTNPDGHAGVNCYMLEGDANPGPTYFFNNTSVSACAMRNPGRGSNTATLQNNQFINYASGAIGDFSSVINTDNGKEVWPSLSTAKSQGYNAVSGAPTSANCNGVSTSSCTVGAGVDLSSICSRMDNAEAAAACMHGIGGVTYDTVNHVAVDNAAVARGSSWDVGAYQFSGSSSNAPAAPTGLTAVIQ